MSSPTEIHPTAVIDPTARIGTGTSVWAHCVIGAGAEIGCDCSLGHGVYIDRDVRLGDRVRVHNKTSVYRPVRIANDVFIGPHVVFVNDPDPTPSGTRDLAGQVWHVRSGVTLGANVTVLSDLELAEHSFVGAGAVVTRPTQAFGVYVGNPAQLVGFRCSCRVRYSLEAGLPARCSACDRLFPNDSAQTPP